MSDESEDVTESDYKKLSRSINRFYGQKHSMNLPGLARYDEPKGKWKPVLKRKWY